MTEAEWLAGDDPLRMLHFSKKCSSRKRQLKFVALCRRVWHLLPSEGCRAAVEVFELYADNEATVIENSERFQTMLRAVDEYEHQEGGVLLREIWSGRAGQADLFWDVIGNPFRPITLNPAWLTPTVISLAQAAYDQRILPSGELDLARLGILSDALQDAECHCDDILSHLRSDGPHVRGC